MISPAAMGGPRVEKTANPYAADWKASSARDFVQPDLHGGEDDAMYTIADTSHARLSRKKLPYCC
jgi:hypothetical protein